MSHQTRQIANVEFTSLDQLGTAVQGIYLEHLKTNLVLDLNKKSARYYGTRMDDGCEAVITYARELTPDEKQQNYEIAVKSSTKSINGVDTPIYVLFADSHAGDRRMEQKLEKVAEEYTIKGLERTAMNSGAISFGEIEGAPDGYRRFCMEVPD